MEIVDFVQANGTWITYTTLYCLLFLAISDGLSLHVRLFFVWSRTRSLGEAHHRKTEKHFSKEARFMCFDNLFNSLQFFNSELALRAAAGAQIV